MTRLTDYGVLTLVPLCFQISVENKKNLKILNFQVLRYHGHLSLLPYKMIKMNGHSVVFGKLVLKFRIIFGFSKLVSVGQGLTCSAPNTLYDVLLNSPKLSL